ncbi:cupin [Terasakiella brassicae]|uniref:Cupin n=1 Tax=Terasakiella brassicae TaxID=1634917 RepID=A0A917BZZ9_9PROT|nr:cupin domain-containing protein [Terasakiella brassicae]GGF65132.1 cupin [Terasakiella brassicae]
MNEAERIIAKLGLQPHPEGGYYVETFRDDEGGERGSCTAIYYLLKAGEKSHWHRVDAVEIWHWYAGAPLNLFISSDEKKVDTVVLGPDILKGERPQGVVPKDAWQAAQSMGEWTLVGCTVSPAFQFEGFEMAPAKWKPGGG